MRGVLGKLQRGIALLAGRATINLIDDKSNVHTAQIEMLEGEIHDSAERFCEYGLASKPPNGTEAIVLSIGGVRSNGVIIATHNRQFCLKALEDGEVALFDDIGQIVKLSRDGIQIITTKPLDISAEQVTIHCDVDVVGTLSASVDVIGGGKSLKTHKHTGVQAGASNTGEPQ